VSLFASLGERILFRHRDGYPEVNVVRFAHAGTTHAQHPRFRKLTVCGLEAPIQPERSRGVPTCLSCRSRLVRTPRTA
jgi:hypothetical protein